MPVEEDYFSAMSCDAHILIFTRFPVPGKAKTRLIPMLGPEGAARIHRRMTEHIVGLARTVSTLGKAAVFVHFTLGREREFRAWLGCDLDYVAQPTGDLGVRLRWAFERAFQDGARAVVAVGSDVPGMTAEILIQALEDLRTHDIVLGPAADGGYTIVGMREFRPELFADVDWGTERVFAQTSVAIRRLGLRLAELPRLNDVDRPEDLSLLSHDPRFADVLTGKPLLSVIIPTLDEAVTIGPILARLYHADTIEVIVSDGGSRDDTREIADQSGASVLRVPGGRAAQQNAGAAAANGRLLLFLHADTLPPDGYADMIRQALDSPTTVAGAFRFQTDASQAVMRLIERTTNFRARVFQAPYGDQGLFMEKRVFDEEGGYAALPVMEDFELLWRLRRRGTIVTLPSSAVTSARRWQQLGVFRTTLINQIMIAGFLAGVPPQRLARLYRNSGCCGHKWA